MKAKKPTQGKSSKKTAGKKPKLAAYVIGILPNQDSVTFTRAQLEKTPFAVGIPSKSKNVVFTKKQLAALRKIERQFEDSRKVPRRSFGVGTSSPEGTGHTTTYWTDNHYDHDWDAVVDQTKDDDN
jgi:hypothetical protein